MPLKRCAWTSEAGVRHSPFGGVGSILEGLGLKARGTRKEDPGSEEDSGEYRSGQAFPGVVTLELHLKATLELGERACEQQQGGMPGPTVWRSERAQSDLVMQVVRRVSRTSGSGRGLPKGTESKGNLEPTSGTSLCSRRIALMRV